jgi:hypothetical protein
MLMTRASVDPLTRGPLPTANGRSSACNRRSATRLPLGTAKLRRAKNSATGVNASTLGVRATSVLGEPSLVVHVWTKACADHAAQPLPLLRTRGGSQVRNYLLHIPLPARGAVPPLFGAEAGEVFGHRGALDVRQRPQVVVPGLRHAGRLARVCRPMHGSRN